VPWMKSLWVGGGTAGFAAAEWKLFGSSLGHPGKLYSLGSIYYQRVWSDQALYRNGIQLWHRAGQGDNSRCLLELGPADHTPREILTCPQK